MTADDDLDTLSATDRIAELESQYSGLETVVLHERARVAELNVENESLEGQLLRQENRIAELEAEVVLLRNVGHRERAARIAELEEDNERLLAGIHVLNLEKDGLEALLKRVSNAEIVSGNLRARIDAALSPEREG